MKGGIYMNRTVINVVKIGSLVFTVLGTIGSAWAGSQENKVLLQDMVNNHFKNN